MKYIERAILFPYNIDAAPILRHKHLLAGIDIIAAISPQGWRISGNDAAYVDGGSAIGMKIDHDLPKALNECDTVILVNSSIEFQYEQYIEMAIDNAKNVICFIELREIDKDKYTKMCIDRGTYFRCFVKKFDINLMKRIMSSKSFHEEKLYGISKPVLFVLGEAEYTNKFQIQLAIRENFKKKGYKISQIGSRNYCEFMGFHSFPSFMYDPLPEIQKILLFNHYVKYIESKENPDIIVIGIPGGIMPISHQFHARFGLLAYYISNAVMPDAVVMSLLYGNNSDEYNQMITTTLKYKFGFTPDCFNLSNASININESKSTKALTFHILDNRYVNMAKSEFDSDIPVYGVFNEKDSIRMNECIINNLTSLNGVEHIV